MIVLSIRNRLEYGIFGAIICGLALWAAYALAITGKPGETLGSLIIGLLGLGLARQFILGPPHIPVGTWLKRMSDITPGYYGQMKTGGGLKIIRSIFYDFHEVRDARNGELLGFEQEINDVWIFTKVPPHREGEKMPPIAFFRTKRRKPEGMGQPRAEIITSDGDVVGHTEYNIAD